MTIFSVSINNLKRKPSRTWILLSIIAVVSCVLFSATLLLTGIRTALEVGASRFGADILVVPATAEREIASALQSGGPTTSVVENTILEQIRRTEGVTFATPRLFLKPSRSSCCFSPDVILVAFDPATDFTLKPFLDKHFQGHIDPQQVLVGKNVKIRPGETIPIYGTLFTVAGHMEPTGLDFFDWSVFLTLDAAHAMADNSRTLALEPISIGKKDISAVLVRVADTARIERISQKIERNVRGVKTFISDVLFTSVKKQLDGFNKAVIAAGIALWCIVFFIVSFAFSMIANERRREIGLWRAMGANKIDISAFFFIEASVLAGAGGAAGITAGYALTQAFSGLAIRFLKYPSLIPSAGALAALAAEALLFAILTGLLAALFPALAAVRKSPYEAIITSD